MRLVGWVWQVSKLLVFTTAEMLESVCGEAVHWYTLSRHTLRYQEAVLTRGGCWQGRGDGAGVHHPGRGIHRSAATISAVSWPHLSSDRAGGLCSDG